MSQPFEKLRDGTVSAAIWRNRNEDGQIFYAVTFDRTYTDKDDKPQSTTSFSGSAILKQQRLAGLAYERIQQLIEADRAKAD